MTDRDSNVVAVRPPTNRPRPVVVPTLHEVTDVLATGAALPLAVWKQLAQHPSLRPGDASSPATGDPLLNAADRLDAPAVARLLDDPRVDANTTGRLTLFPWPVSVLTAAVAALPPAVLAADSVNGPTPPWTDAQRVSQEVIVGLLLAAGVEIHDRTWSFAANVRQRVITAEDSNPRILQRLLATGHPFPTPLDGSRFTLLHRMTTRNSDWPEAIVQAVLAGTPDVDTTNVDGNTALAFGLRQTAPCMGLLRALLDAGADPCRANPGGKRPVHHWANANGPAEALDLLLAHGARLDSVWHVPEDRQPMMLSQAHPYTAVDGLLPLHEAASCNSVRSLDHLLALGVDPDVPDRRAGNTALHWAVANRSLQATARLLDAGASIAVRNRAGLLPLDMLQVPRAWPAAAPDHEILALLERRALGDTLATMPDGAPVASTDLEPAGPGIDRPPRRRL